MTQQQRRIQFIHNFLYLLRTWGFKQLPKNIVNFTILLDVVVWIIVSTPGSHLDKSNTSEFPSAPRCNSNDWRKDSPGWLSGCWTTDRGTWRVASDPRCTGRPASAPRSTQDRSPHRYSPAGDKPALTNKLQLTNTNLIRLLAAYFCGYLLH